MSCQSVTNVYSELIQNTLTSYRQGFIKPLEPPASDCFALFYEDWQTFIENLFSPTEQKLFNKFEIIRTNGLNAARQGNLIKAEKYFKIARTKFNLEQLSPPKSLLFLSALERSEAYLDCRLGDFDKARNRTLKSLETYVYLEQECGYDIFFLRRFQLLCNLVQLEAGNMNYQKAIELASELLSYFEGNLETLPFPGDWGRERIMGQSQELMAATFALVTCEIAKILVTKNHQLTQELWEIVQFNLQLQTNNNCYCHPHSYFWLLVKQAFANKDVSKFLNLVAQFLVEGRTDTPLLWYATVIDFVKLVNELELPEVELIKQEILKDSVNWKDCPPKFRHVLELDLKNEDKKTPAVLNNLRA